MLSLRQLVLVLFILGLDWEISAQKIFRTEYNKMLEIPTNVFWGASQDDNGYLWLLSQKGLIKYDGVEWEVLPDSLKLPTHLKSEIFHTPEGELCTAGLSLDGTKNFSWTSHGVWTRLKVPGEPSINDLYDISYHSRFGKVVAHLGLHSLYLFSDFHQRWVSYPRSEIGINPTVHNIRITGDYLWVLSDRSPLRFSITDDGLTKASLPSFLDADPLFDIAYSATGDTLVTLGKDYVALYDQGREFKRITDRSFNRIDNNAFSSIILSDNILYYTCSSPLFIYDLVADDSMVIYNKSGADRTVWTDAFIDRQGILWLMNQRELIKLVSLAFANYTEAQGLLESEVSTVKHFSNGTFLGHNTGFTIIYDNGDIWKYPFPEMKKSSRILSADLGKDGLLYAACSNFGLQVIDPDQRTVRRFRHSPEFSSAVIIKSDTLWYSNLAEVFRYYGNKVVKVTSARQIRKMSISSSGKLLGVNFKGVTVLDPVEKADSDRPYDSRINAYAHIVYQGVDLIAGLGGIYIWTGDDYLPYQVNNTDFNHASYALAVDGRDRLWVGTADGCYLIKDNQQLNYFHHQNGLASNEINRSGLTVDANGEIWIGTEDGLSIYDPRKERKQALPPLPNIESINVGEVSLPFDAQVQIPRSENDFEISYSAPSFYDETQLRYRYRLCGYDTRWRMVDQYANRIAYFTNIPPGKYTFELQAMEVGNTWSKSVKSPVIEMIRPMWQQWWFIALILLLFLISLLAINSYLYRYRLTSKLETMLDQRMEEVMEYQKELESQNIELTRVNGELDTFVYSVSHDLRGPIASSIGLIGLLEKDPDPGSQQTYLNLIKDSMYKLDEFINDILRIARNTRLEVNHEEVAILEMIQDIIDHQRFREGADQINFDLQIDPGVKLVTDPERIRIVLLNLISNAINYRDEGKEKSTIRISYSNLSDRNVIEVWDNGIGINKEFQEKVFDIFYRANESKSGSGLGLYIVAQIIDKLNGKISLNSLHGRWTSFRIELPKLEG